MVKKLWRKLKWPLLIIFGLALGIAVGIGFAMLNNYFAYNDGFQ